MAIRVDRKKPSRTIAPLVEEHILEALKQEHALIADKNIPITTYNYSAIADLLKEKYDLSDFPVANFARANHDAGNSFLQSIMYLPPNTPSVSICFGVRSGLKSGAKSFPSRAVHT